MVTIKVGRDFSDIPIGVHREDSNHSAEAFREDFLIPLLRKNYVQVDLSGTLGYGASFLQGVFEILYTSGVFNEEYIDTHMRVFCSDSKDRCYVESVYRYIQQAKKLIADRKKNKEELDKQRANLVNAMNLVNEAYQWFIKNNYDKPTEQVSMKIMREIGQLLSDISDYEKVKMEMRRKDLNATA